MVPLMRRGSNKSKGFAVQLQGIAERVLALESGPSGFSGRLKDKSGNSEVLNLDYST